MTKKGLSTVEYCVLFALVVAAFLAMHVYLKRAIQGNWRTNMETISDEQYEPGVTMEPISQPLKIMGPEIAVDINKDDSTDVVYDLAASYAGPIQVPGWGTYIDGRSHESQ